MKVKYWSLVAGVACVALLHGPSPASAQAVLGTAQSFAVLGGSAVTNTGPTTVIGNLGVSPGSAVTGFPPGLVTGGTIHANDAVAMQAQSDVTTAYNFLALQPVNTDLTGTDLGGLTLLPGVYHFSSSAQLTGMLTLDAQGDPNAVFIFQIGSTLTTASNSRVALINGAQNCNVFWQVGSSATLGTGTAFAGNILALASITLTTGASASGRTLARNGAVTLDTNAVAVADCIASPPFPPVLSKAFGPATINAGDASTLTITLSNPNTSAATLTSAFTDTLPTGVVIAATPNASTTCDGGSTVTANAGGSTITLAAGRSIPAGTSTTAGSCTVTVDVTAAAGGVYLNTIPVGALQTSNGNNAAAAVATLAVNSSVTLSKAFNPAIINAGGVSTLTITLGNDNGSAATLTAALIDHLPSGMVVAATPNASTTCDGGSTVTAVAGGTTVTLPTGRSIPATSSCTVTVDVTAAAGASYLNTLPIGALKTDKGSNAVPASAALVVNAVPPVPTLSKAFVPATINAGDSSTLTVTLINPNTSPAVLTADLVDTLPTGVVIATPPNASTTCGDGVLAVANGSTVTLQAGNSIPATGFCTVTVDVTAAAAGIYLNTIAAGALETSNGTNAAPASATLAVINTAATPPTLSKSFAPSVIIAGRVSLLTITLSNPNLTAATLIAPLTDTLPGGVVIAAVPNASTTCTGIGPVAATPGGTTVILPATYSIPGGTPGTCTVTVNVTAPAAGNFQNTLAAGALQSTNGSNAAPASATLHAVSVSVPLLSGWAMVLLPALLCLVAFAMMRSQTM